MYTVTCAVSTTEIGGSSWDTCASNKGKKANKSANEVFFLGWVVVPDVKLQKLSSATSFGGFFTHL